MLGSRASEPRGRMTEPGQRLERHRGTVVCGERNGRGMQGLMAGKGLISETVGGPGALVKRGLCQSISDTASWGADAVMNGSSCPSPSSTVLTAHSLGERLKSCSRALVSSPATLLSILSIITHLQGRGKPARLKVPT
ncbi:hypothetical protein NQZ68_021776 [Dissostichus eleginoides]|nr:hypothetical protein NQZ68_021776 [Dissostichus eleginoides]